ncbi:MAG: hypothetical protein ACLR0P_00420 [Oscillospiraceae bacterium]
MRTRSARCSGAMIVPNTVTKTIHTDRVLQPGTSPHISTWSTSPATPPFESQIRTIHSFDRPVILVDDLLHSGNRIRALDPHPPAGGWWTSAPGAGGPAVRPRDGI